MALSRLQSLSWPSSLKQRPERCQLKAEHWLERQRRLGRSGNSSYPWRHPELLRHWLRSWRHKRISPKARSSLRSQERVRLRQRRRCQLWVPHERQGGVRSCQSQGLAEPVPLQPLMEVNLAVARLQGGVLRSATTSPQTSQRVLSPTRVGYPCARCLPRQRNFLKAHLVLRWRPSTCVKLLLIWSLGQRQRLAGCFKQAN